MKNSLAQWKLKLEIGDIYLVASERGLQSIYFHKERNVPYLNNLEEKNPQTEILTQAYRELTEYFAGTRKIFTVPLDVQGTEFQNRVWAELRKIPYGKTCSYKEIASRLKTNAIRAVGTANGRNPLSIIIPCHRVINTGGGLGGYSGGLDIKRKLLALEAEF